LTKRVKIRVTQTGYHPNMLWTILVVLAIIALVLFIVGYFRRGRV
jgi:hypothetical protein